MVRHESGVYHQARPAGRYDLTVMHWRKFMSYRERLSHWAVMRRLPNQRWIVIARFRNRSDADGHAEFLRLHLPPGDVQVVFEVPEAGSEDSGD